MKFTVEPGEYEDTVINVNRTGICPPEYPGENSDCVSFVMEYLKDRNIIYDVRVE